MIRERLLGGIGMLALGATMLAATLPVRLAPPLDDSLTYASLLIPLLAALAAAIHLMRRPQCAASLLAVGAYAVMSGVALLVAGDVRWSWQDDRSWSTALPGATTLLGGMVLMVSSAVLVAGARRVVALGGSLVSPIVMVGVVGVAARLGLPSPYPLVVALVALGLAVGLLTRRWWQRLMVPLALALGATMLMTGVLLLRGPDDWTCGATPSPALHGILLTVLGVALGGILHDVVRRRRGRTWA